MKTLVGTTTPGDRCEWCGEPATTTVEVQPGRSDAKGEVIELPVLAAACVDHASVGAGGGRRPERGDPAARARHTAARSVRRRAGRRHQGDRCLT